MRTTIDNDTGEVLSPDLEAIRARAAAADGAANPPPQDTGVNRDDPPQGAAPSTEQPVPFAKRLAGDMLAIGNMLSMRFPSLKVVYTLENCTRSADDIAPALEKLGWDYGEDKGGLMYARAIGAVAMMGMATRDAIVFDLAKEQQAAAASSSSSSPPGGEPDASAAMPQMDLYR